ncbi:MAG: riboflavin biosynthesis protein [Lysobacteraceae bacterium]|nr:MAG: riboflavin biosynthesis protein [Xanthomonadaceae bacterium]
MRLIRGFAKSLIPVDGLTLGNFDGVHLGHKHLVAQAAKAGPRCAVVTFHPHASEFFAPDKAPARLYRCRDKIEFLSRETAAQLVSVLRFNQQLASMSAAAFFDALWSAYQPTKVVVGGDFRYGKGREGTIDTLAMHCAERNVELQVAESLLYDGQRVSSTRVRQAIAASDFDTAAALLGRPYCIAGKVVYGQALGRTLGFPTVNLPLPGYTSPLHGVFAVRVHGDGWSRDGVANIGTRPAVGGGHWLLEAHLFDFDQNVYGQRLAVEFVAKLRNEEMFEQLDLMVEQMKLDAAKAQDILSPAS